MTFAERLHSREFPVALEITPPRRASHRVLLRRAGMLGPAAPVINVIQRTGRQSSLEASIELRAAGFEPVWHLVTRGRTRATIRADLAAARDAGIGTVLCIRGDNDRDDTPDTPTIREAVELARESMVGAVIGATFNQHGPRQATLRNLLPKLRAGATYIQTQPAFDLAALFSAAETVREASPGTRIMAMAMPLLSLEAFNRIRQRLGVPLPEEIGRDLATGGVSAGWARFEATLAALSASPLIDGLAIMTFETDPPPEYGPLILAALRRAGCLSPAAG